MEQQLPPIPITTEEWDNKFNEDSDSWLFGREPSELAKLTMTYWRLLAKDRIAQIIDLGCGQGRDAVYFAKHGMEVTAIDGSQSALERTKWLANDVGTKLHKAILTDVSDFLIEPGFDIYYSHNCFQFLGDKCLTKIEEVMNATAPGGMNAISVFTDDAKRATGIDGIYCLRHNQLREIYSGWRMLLYEEGILWREPSLAYLSFAKIIAVKETKS